MKRDMMMVWICAIGLGLCGLGLQAEASTITLNNGKTIQAKAIQWREGAQEYRVEEGATQTIIPVAKNQVAALEVDKPAEYDKAVQLASSSPDQAIAILKEMVSNYRMCIWDNKARGLMAQIYAKQKDSKRAVSTLEELFKNAQPWEDYADLRRFYWDMLLQAQMTSTLKKEMEEAIATGSDAVVAQAQVMRGNINRDAGMKEEALLDYLRTILLFGKITQVQPEALYKAAEILEEMRDPRASDLKKTLVQKYPGSEYAKKVGGGM